MGKIPSELWLKAKDVSLVDVVSSRVPLKKKGVSYVGECPWHSDSSKDSLSISEKRNRWKCFVCDKSGDAVDFVAEYDGISNTHALCKVLYESSLISQAEYEEYSKEKAAPVKREVKVKKEKVYPVLAPLLDPVSRDRFYAALAKACGLTDEDKEYLITKRGVSKKDLGLFFSVPDKNDMDKVLEKVKLILKTKTLSSYLGVPGLYQDRIKKKIRLADMPKGIAIKVIDEDEFIQAIHIRKNTITEGEKRYTWLTSSFADGISKDGGKGSRSLGCSSGSPCFVMRPEGDFNKICITEGEFKAVTLAKEGFLTISVQGISNWKLALPIISKVLKETGKKDMKIYLAFDSDFLGNKAVKDTILLTGDALEKKRLRPRVLIWDDMFGKGIDDVILAGHKKKILSYSFKRFKEINERIEKTSIKALKNSLFISADFPKLEKEEDKIRAAALKEELIGISFEID